MHRECRECRERFPCHRLHKKSLVGNHASRHVRHARTEMHVGIANPWWRGKPSRHSRRMRSLQFYVSGKRPVNPPCVKDHFPALGELRKWLFVDVSFTLQWRHGERDGVSNHQPRKCLLNRLSRHISKKTSKLRVTGLCEGNSPVTGEFPAQRDSNTDNVSIWWRHHAIPRIYPAIFLQMFRHITK